MKRSEIYARPTAMARTANRLNDNRMKDDGSQQKRNNINKPFHALGDTVQPWFDEISVFSIIF